ncbi:MAG TPA: DUF4019 domain-containing protein [Methylibium sp.]|uniref:DUF4019 domain-containing protein n=1 Tax=Methylibium sp. TaxID=2067992 RepID=UPI002DBDA7A3|nr:DUF4019 domain-containing protein [Methylibium sp.]HEU4458682.1 DUF4019 domain-containing protein [Methylibium sp.]
MYPSLRLRLRQRRGFFVACAGMLFISGAAAGKSATRKGADVAPGDFFLSFTETNIVRQAAEKVLRVIDSQAADRAVINGLYESGSEALKGRYSEAAFGQRLYMIRRNLGPMVRRQFNMVSGGFHSLPNLPSGRYAIAMFETEFRATGGFARSEELTMSWNDAAREWLFVEYYVGNASLN